jgi:hypothetical protein
MSATVNPRTISEQRRLYADSAARSKAWTSRTNMEQAIYPRVLFGRLSRFRCEADICNQTVHVIAVLDTPMFASPVVMKETGQ